MDVSRGLVQVNGLMIVASPPKPKIRDAARTREAILRSAQKLFARKGYSTTGVREVAADAGVSLALVRRYFQTKEGLLREALEDILRIEPLIEGDRSAFGERAVSILIQGDTADSPMAMLILATADPIARSMCSEIMHHQIIVPLADWLGGPRALERAARLNILWIGFMTTRSILPIQALSSEPVDPTRGWLEEITQAIADGRA